jgi:N6-L-threonylcarbamoyladenine synthase
MKGRPGCDFSFSGLKTAVRHAVAALGEPAPRDVADLAAAVQEAIADCLVDRTANAARLFRERWPTGAHLVAAGGVAANGTVRARLTALAERAGLAFLAPPVPLCTDNAAMIAWAGLERLKLGLRDGLDFAPRPRWPLDPNAPKSSFAGAAKA